MISYLLYKETYLQIAQHPQDIKATKQKTALYHKFDSLSDLSLVIVPSFLHSI
jgi:hypothetical protein